ncbi:MAG: hypothetical protein E7043_05720 [Lentisphaerae bacterium]|nr:hypothetical protein [Lentisphaerota bacterium]
MNERFYEGITLDNRAVRVAVSGGKIISCSPVEPHGDLPRLLPLLVDLQQNGALGYAFNQLNGDNAREALSAIGEHLLVNGVGRVLATIPTAPYEVLKTAARSIGEVLDADDTLDRLYAGIFHEGVFISPDKGWRGGHKPEYILAPQWEMFSELNSLSGSRVKLVNVAPEVPGALKFIRRAADSGINVAIGHCHPDAETIRQAVKAGARMVTHFANGSAPQIHRFKNPLWGFLAEEGLALGLVGDGFHLPPEVTCVAMKVKGHERCFMVSDANMFSGCVPGIYQRIGGLDCQIEENGFIHVVGEDILAGAWFQNNRSVEYLVNYCKVDFETAWRMCSTIPAELCGIKLPELSCGEEAGFVLADFKNGSLSIRKTVFNGIEYQKQN